MEKLYDDVTSLYRLDQKSTSVTSKAELGPLPKTAVILLSALGLAWLLIIVYVCREAVKHRKTRHNAH